jgi:hypothetical protein
VLLQRLSAMSMSNSNKSKDLIKADIEMIRVCLKNLLDYFGKDQQNTNILMKINQIEDYLEEIASA